MKTNVTIKTLPVDGGQAHYILVNHTVVNKSRSLGATIRLAEALATALHTGITREVVR